MGGTLAQVSDLLSGGSCPQRDFSQSLAVYTPNNEAENGGADIVRAAADARPIGLETADDEILCTTWNLK